MLQHQLQISIHSKRWIDSVSVEQCTKYSKKWLKSDTKAKWNSENTKINFIMMLLSFPLFKCVFNLNSIANNWFIAFICFYMIFIMTQAYERLIRRKKRNEPIAAIVNRKKPFQITIEDLIRFHRFCCHFSSCIERVLGKWSSARKLIWIYEGKRVISEE